MTTQYIAIESATGDVYQVAAADEDKAYRALARHVLKMPDWNAKDFDTGNVDFDLYAVTDLAAGKVEKRSLGGT